MDKDLIKVLIKTQSELPVIKRDTEAYNYKYAPLENIMEKVLPILQKNGFAVIHRIALDGVHTTAFHDKGELGSHFPFSGATKPQERGSEITYGKRYNIVAIFNIQLEGEDDDGKKAQDAKPTKKMSSVDEL